MRSREVFEQAREAALRIRDIEIRLELMHERIGMQGRALEASFAQGNDPMRKVDELLDWEAEEYRTVMASSREAIGDAKTLLRGLCASGGEEAARAIELVYLDAIPVEGVAQLLGVKERVVTAMCDGSFLWIDSVGIAKVKEAGRVQAG